MMNRPTKKQLREFGFLVGFGFPILIGWVLPAFTGHLFRTWTLFVGSPFLTLAIFKPLTLLYPYRAWMALGHSLGWINSRLILGLIFLLVLQPIALIMRFFGYDPLREKRINKKSYREDKQGHITDLTRIF